MILPGLIKYAAVAIATLLVVVGIYRAGGSAARAELEAFQTQTRLQAERIAEENATDKAASMTLIAQLEKKNADDSAAMRTRWAQWVREHSGRRSGAESVRVDSRVCQDAAGNADVSRAVSAYLVEVGRFRSDVEGLLERADQDASDLADVRKWIAGEQVIHQVKGEPR